jgi:nitrile hydratase subunit beta
MDGIHDLGGMHGFGRVEREENEPVFHAPWERTVVAIFGAVRGAGLINTDEFRHAIERMDPAHYLAASYWERWLDGMVRLLSEKGLIDRVEVDILTDRLRIEPDASPPRPPSAPSIAMSEHRPPATSFRESTARPRFTVGDAVMTAVDHRSGHTRLPRYVRGRRGVVVARRGVHVFPDANAHGLGEEPQHVYGVRFTGAELWGPAAEPNQAVHIDLWESYLQPA